MNCGHVPGVDLALILRAKQQRARYVSLVLCRIQQRLESRNSSNQHWSYAVACEAEVFAVIEELKFQDAIPEVAATSLGGVVAKLEMIIQADREIDDHADFPWPHIVSVLQDLEVIAGCIPEHRPDRELVRTDIARHCDAAAMLIEATTEGNTACRKFGLP